MNDLLRIIHSFIHSFCCTVVGKIWKAKMAGKWMVSHTVYYLEVWSKEHSRLSRGTPQSHLEKQQREWGFHYSHKSLLWSDVRALCYLFVSLLCARWDVFEWAEPHSKMAGNIQDHGCSLNYLILTFVRILFISRSLARSLPPSLMLVPPFSFSRCPQMAFALLYRAELRRASFYRHDCQTPYEPCCVCVGVQRIE